MAKARRFYGMLGLDIPENDEDHVEALGPGGIRIMFDKLDFIKRIDPEWVTPVGQRVGLAFKCDSPDEVDTMFAKIVRAGLRTKDTAPYDAFWGQRYASVFDADGNTVDLFADLPRK